MVEIVTVGMLLIMACGVFSGFPVALVLTGTGILGFFAAAMMGLTDFQHLGLYYLRVRGTLTNEGVQFTSVPLLILLGMVLNGSGIASTIFHTLGHMLRGLRGRYAIATLLVGLILAPAAGVIGASVITVALVAYHPMLNAGYSPRAAGGAVAASGALGVIFPPAIMLFFVATLFRLRISVMYMSMVIPVLLLVILFSIYFIATIRAKDDGGPIPEGTEKPQYLSMIAALAVIASIPWSIVSGVATLSEAAGIGVFGSLLLVAVRGQLSLAMLHNAIMRTGTLTAMVFFIVVGATVFSLSFHLVGGPDVLFSWITGFNLNRWQTLGLLLGLVLVLGFVFDWMEILLVFLPIFLPIFQQLDFSDHVGSAYAATVWLGALIALTLQTSFLTPPFGYALFFAKMTAPPSVVLADIYRGAIPLVILEVVLLVLVVLFPTLVIWLPKVSLNLSQLSL
jgi:tripartite ATP-independent transporter DctM subunit